MTVQSIDNQALASMLLNSPASTGRFGERIRRIGAIWLVPNMGRKDLIGRGQSSGE